MSGAGGPPAPRRKHKPLTSNEPPRTTRPARASARCSTTAPAARGTVTQEMDVAQPEQLDFGVMMRDAEDAGQQQRVRDSQRAGMRAQPGHWNRAASQLRE